MTKNPKQGSALLIVLGFLSFMVVSAVAFAIYMRTERLPSSALRRNVANRYLVQAALAQAMSRVDDAIRADPFPGLCDTNQNATTAYRDYQNNVYDFWEGRVFMPPDQEGATDPNDTQYMMRYAPSAETVSVLNLEALGYLPPSLVNDVRFLSRASWAAKWDQFLFDAGRYAFCCVNVSDFFDINKLSMELIDGSGCRTSGNPISLAYLFSGNAKKFTPDSSLLNSFTTLLETPPGGEDGMTTVPFVSMLDYALAFGKKYSDGFGSNIKFESPFWKWVSGNNGSDWLYRQNSDNSGAAMLQGAKRQTFVTDSWFPADEATFELINGDRKDRVVPDLANTKESDSKHYGQPFKLTDLNKQKSPSVQQVINMQQSLPFWQMYEKKNKQGQYEQKGVLRYMSYYDSLVLWDYLDRNNVPLSLALPCAERVPMIAGVQPVLDSGKQLLKMKAQAPSGGLAGTLWNEETSYTIEDMLTTRPRLAALTVYPFKGFKSANYKVSAYAQMQISAVPDTAQNGYLRSSKASVAAKEYQSFRAGGWKAGASLTAFNGNVMLIPLVCESEQGVSFDAPEREADVWEDPVRFTLKKPAFINSQVILTKTEQYPTTMQNDVLVKQPGSAPVATFYTFGLDPLDQNGNGMGLVGKQLQQADLAAQKFAVTMSVWVRISDGNDTVDLMPATYDDDDLIQSGDGAIGSALYAGQGVAGGQDTQPYLKFVVSDAFNFDTVVSTVPAGGVVDCIDYGDERLNPAAYTAVDPRFNWAPEDVLAVDKSDAKNLDGNEWLKRVFHSGGSSYVRACGQYGGTDADPFMFVSNQGYLQSMGELAFIPRLNGGGGVTDNLLGKGGSYDGRLRTAAADLANRQCMWQGNPLITMGGNVVPVWNWGVENSTSSFRVNPYTDNPTIFQAVVANTPMNYWLAGTNTTSQGVTDTVDSSEKKTTMDSITKWKKYVVGEDNDFGLEMKYDDICYISEALRTALRAGGIGGDNWKTAYDTLWDAADGLFYNEEGNSENEATKLWGRNLGSNCYLHSADRKHLCSFWHDSLANRQQLFLFFVRAESNALGGSGEGTPAQQGGRAVALVWRDPDPPTGQNVHDSADIGYRYSANAGQTNQPNDSRHPHKMRVLFYHQFD